MNQKPDNHHDSREMLYYPVPHLWGQPQTETPAPNRDAPAVLSYIIRVRNADGGNAAGEQLYFYIGRDASVALASFTLSYRFSPLPVMMDDAAHPFYTYQYTDADINDNNAYIVCKFTLPKTLSADFRGCSAYVSALTTKDGTTVTYEPNDFFYSDADTENAVRMMNADGSADASADASALDPADEASYKREKEASDDAIFDALEAEQNRQRENRKKKSRGVRIVGYTLLVVGIATLITIGVQRLSYQSTMLGVQVFLDAGEYRQAEQYAEEKSGGDFFYQSRKSALARTIKQLCAEGRYNEAYKIVSMTPYATLLEAVCREAAAAALAAGDYETAYVYAKGAPDPFDAEITAAATEVLLDPYNGGINESAYRVAQKTTDSAVRDDLLLSIVSYACANNNYHVAMRAAKQISDSAIGASTVADVFGIAARYYIGKGSFQAAANFISLYRTEDGFIDADIQNALIAYFSESRDAKSAFFLARQFGIDASDIPIKPGDSAVRNDLSGIYPLLTQSQKRDYHRRSISTGGILFALDGEGGVTLCAKPSGVTPENGRDFSMQNAQKRVNALLSGKSKVVSVVSGALTTAFLHSDGSVTMLSNRIIGGTETPITAEENQLLSDAQKLKNVVSIAAGESHFVYLLDNGRVVCSGANTHGECDTNGSAWRDIVAVAAGGAFTLGLKSDGSVVACGADTAGQCKVSSLSNVVDIAACDQTSVFLFRDGTVGIRGEHSMGLADAANLTGVTKIRAGGCAVIAELSDGTYVICGTCAQSGNYGSVASWHSMADYDVGIVCAAAIDENGAVRTTGTNRAKQ